MSTDLLLLLRVFRVLLAQGAGNFSQNLVVHRLALRAGYILRDRDKMRCFFTPELCLHKVSSSRGSHALVDLQHRQLHRH